jgi:hypothetical protein
VHNLSNWRPQLTVPRPEKVTLKQEAKVLPNFSTSVQTSDHRPQRITLIALMKKALRPGNKPESKGFDQEWTLGELTTTQNPR